MYSEYIWKTKMEIFTKEIFLNLFFFRLDKLNICLVEVIGGEMNTGDGKGLKDP